MGFRKTSSGFFQFKHCLCNHFWTVWGISLEYLRDFTKMYEISTKMSTKNNWLTNVTNSTATFFEIDKITKVYSIFRTNILYIYDRMWYLKYLIIPNWYLTQIITELCELTIWLSISNQKDCSWSNNLREFYVSSRK